MNARRADRRLAVLAAGFIAAGAVIAGCGSSSSSGNASGSSGGSSLSVGLVGFDASVVASAVETDAAAAQMKAAGWKVQEQDPAGDATKANSLCSQYVSEKLDAVVVSTFSYDQMAACLATASAANVPVFFIATSGLSKGVAGAISVTAAKPVNESFGKYLASLKNPRILSLQYSAGAPCVARANYFNSVVKKAGIPSSAVQVNQVRVPGQVSDAENATTAWLNAHPASNGQDLVIWTCFSDPALGAYAALQQDNRNVPIFTWDVTPQLVKMVRSGAIHTTGINDPAGMGKQLVQMIKAYRSDGGKPKVEAAPYVVITKANINAYLKANPHAVG